MKKNKSYHQFFMQLTKLLNVSFLLFGLYGKSLAQDTTNLMGQLEKEAGEKYNENGKEKEEGGKEQGERGREKEK